ncbi:unnamed protein product [Cylindrotheca closterium]|uniref:Uncharacterized protein n=1 Tax=Cylindrotheca closterium TaxID=2856 RepID=A0AAD2FZE9_9STRA|nr:unnamed protein product [Cylindrotheca closterium]
MKVKSIMDEDPSSDVSHLFPLKVETPNDRSVEVKKMEAEVKRLWKEVGDLIEEYVLISVELLTKCQDPEAYNKATIEKDSHEEFLMESVSEALVACIRMGQYAGYQNGQQKAKNSQGLADNKWIYSFVQEGSDKWMQVLSPKKRDCPAMCSISKRQKMD